MNEEEMKAWVTHENAHLKQDMQMMRDQMMPLLDILARRKNNDMPTKEWVQQFVLDSAGRESTGWKAAVDRLGDWIREVQADMPTKEWTNQLILRIIDFQKHEPKDSDYVPFDDVNATNDLKKTMEIADKMHEAVREGREPLILEEYTDAQKPPEAWMKKFVEIAGEAAAEEMKKFMEIAEMGDKLKQSPEMQKAQARAANFLKFMHTVPDPLFRQFLDFDPAKLDDYVPPKAWGNFNSPEADQKIKDFMDARKVKDYEGNDREPGWNHPFSDTMSKSDFDVFLTYSKLREKEIGNLRREIEALKDIRPMRDSMPTTIRVERVPATKAEVIAHAGQRCSVYEVGCATCEAWDSWDRTGTITCIIDRAELLK